MKRQTRVSLWFSCVGNDEKSREKQHGLVEWGPRWVALHWSSRIVTSTQTRWREFMIWSTNNSLFWNLWWWWKSRLKALPKPRVILFDGIQTNQLSLILSICNPKAWSMAAFFVHFLKLHGSRSGMPGRVGPYTFYQSMSSCHNVLLLHSSPLSLLSFNFDSEPRSKSVQLLQGIWSLNCSIRTLYLQIPFFIHSSIQLSHIKTLNVLETMFINSCAFLVELQNFLNGFVLKTPDDYRKKFLSV